MPTACPWSSISRIVVPCRFTPVTPGLSPRQRWYCTFRSSNRSDTAASARTAESSRASIGGSYDPAAASNAVHVPAVNDTHAPFASDRGTKPAVDTCAALTSFTASAGSSASVRSVSFARRSGISLG